MSKRLYLLVQLKRARLPCRDFSYVTCIRSILACAVHVSFCARSPSICNYLNWSGLKRSHCQTVCPKQFYNKALQEAGKLATISNNYKDIIYMTMFLILFSRTRKIGYIIYYLDLTRPRQSRHFSIPKWRINCFSSTFLVSSF